MVNQPSRSACKPIIIPLAFLPPPPLLHPRPAIHGIVKQIQPYGNILHFIVYSYQKRPGAKFPLSIIKIKYSFLIFRHEILTAIEISLLLFNGNQISHIIRYMMEIENVDFNLLLLITILLRVIKILLHR